MMTMIAKVFLSAAVAMATLPAWGSTPLQKADCGSIDRLMVYSPELQDSIAVDVWRPENFDASARYPVVYMHDGQNLYDASTTWNHQSWEMDSVASSLIAADKIKPMIIVGIHSDPATRVSQLMPQKAVSNAGLDDLMAEVKLKGQPILGDKYAEFVVMTLKPLIDTSYPTLRDRDNTAVMGSSMGGLMSLYLISEYPEVFGGAGCLSTHWYGSLAAGTQFGDAMMHYVDSKLPDPATHRLYFDHGTATIDAYYGPWNTQALLKAQSKGYEYGKTLDSFVDYGAPHEESAWAGRVARPLVFLFGK